MMTRYGNIVGNISALGGYYNYKIMASCLISQKPCWMKVINFHAWRLHQANTNVLLIALFG
jgi:hypothetical protein